MDLSLKMSRVTCAYARPTYMLYFVHYPTKLFMNLIHIKTRGTLT